MGELSLPQPADDFFSRVNSGLLLDLYELNMAQSYLKEGMEKQAVFDITIRGGSANRGYYVAAGMQTAAQFAKHMRFEKESIEYLDGLKRFSEEFLAYLEKFRFGGEIFAVKEGEVVFSGEPMLKVKAPIIHAQLLESYFLNAVGFQTMVATKASRVCIAAKGRAVVDFGMRRAHGADASLKAARASYIGGCAGTSNMLAGKMYGIPVYGTVAHSYVMAHESELAAFRAWACTNKNATLLIDTYDTIQGAKNAIKIAKEMRQKGSPIGGVRIDSNKAAKESAKVRRMLDNAGMKGAKITISGSLDEYKIAAFLKQGGAADFFGVGTAMVVSSDMPFLDINYKIAAYGAKPAMKKTQGKESVPCDKQVYRKIKNGKFASDTVGLDNESCHGEKLLALLLEGGRIKPQSLEQAKEYAKERLAMLPQGCIRLENPAKYKVIISGGLVKIIKEL